MIDHLVSCSQPDDHAGRFVADRPHERDMTLLVPFRRTCVAFALVNAGSVHLHRASVSGTSAVADVADRDSWG